MRTTSSNNSGPLQKSTSPLLQYRSSEQVHTEQNREATFSTHDIKNPQLPSDLSHEQMNKDKRNFSDVNHISDTKLPQSNPTQSNDVLSSYNQEQDIVRKNSDTMVEQARHNRRASERKLRKSQKVVNRLLVENENGSVGAHRTEFESRKKYVQIAEDKPEIIEDNPPPPLDNWFDKVDSPEPQFLEVKKEDATGWKRVNSPTGGTNLKLVSPCLVDIIFYQLCWFIPVDFSRKYLSKFFL